MAVEEVVDQRVDGVGRLIGGQVPHLIQYHQLRAGNRLGHPAHFGNGKARVLATGDDQGRGGQRAEVGVQRGVVRAGVVAEAVATIARRGQTLAFFTAIDYQLLRPTRQAADLLRGAIRARRLQWVFFFPGRGAPPML